MALWNTLFPLQQIPNGESKGIREWRRRGKSISTTEILYVYCALSCTWRSPRNLQSPTTFRAIDDVRKTHRAKRESILLQYFRGIKLASYLHIPFFTKTVRCFKEKKKVVLWKEVIYGDERPVLLLTLKLFPALFDGISFPSHYLIVLFLSIKHRVWALCHRPHK